MAKQGDTRWARAVRGQGRAKPKPGGTGGHSRVAGSRVAAKRAQKAKEAKEAQEELNRDLGAAAEIQACLMPPKMPQIPGYDVWTAYLSAKIVGGDYYDFFPVDKERLGIAVADVSGKGIPGAMVMASTRTLFRVLGPQCGSAAETLRRTNYHVARDIKRGMFVTAMLAVLNVHTREMEVCSAGHNPMVVYFKRRGRIGLMNPAGMALGFDKGEIFDRILVESRLRLELGDRVVLYTDGVVEAMNSKNEQYGDDRFYKFVLRNAHMTSKDFVRALTRDLDEHKGEAEQHDDITIVTFKVTE